MAKKHGDHQRDKHDAGRGFEEIIVKALQSMLEKNGLDDDFEIVGKERNRRSGALVIAAPLLPGARISEMLRPDFGIRHKASGRFAAYGGAKKSFRERDVQDYHIARRIKEMNPDSFWFECTVAERDDDTSEQIKQNLTRRHAVWGGAWDVIASTSVPETMTAMRGKLASHLKAWHARQINVAA